MMIDVFLLIYTFILIVIAVWAAYSSYLVIKCGVPPVPTGRRICAAMIREAGLKERQKIYDLGCGFGDILLLAAKTRPSNQYQGYDINRPVIWIAKLRNRLLQRNIQLESEDFFTKDLGDADVIFCYLWPSIMERIETEIWPCLNPGTKVISHGFKLPNIVPNKQVSSGKNQVFVYLK